MGAPKKGRGDNEVMKAVVTLRVTTSNPGARGETGVYHSLRVPRRKNTPTRTVHMVMMAMQNEGNGDRLYAEMQTSRTQQIHYPIAALLPLLVLEWPP
jgi:hypothetical protein